MLQSLVASLGLGYLCVIGVVLLAVRRCYGGCASV